ncbi:MAG TPA: PQQ-dependent dehydrogenase, methanol/ethanol family [Luteitalea sp.]|nr:PQQ-dependent dehydrogenase, methanol/ethanol family [Luteitalea sp.]
MHRALAVAAAVPLGAALVVLSANRPLSAQQASSESRGATLFAERCALCHGGDGRGGERGPDLVTGNRSAGRSVDEIARIIRSGVPGGGMPPIDLPAADLQAVASHVRTWAQAARQPRTYPRVAATTRDGARVEGLVLAESGADLHLLRADGALQTVARTGATVTALDRTPMPTLTPRSATSAPAAGDWATYNGDERGNRHTALTQIGPSTVGDLRPAWTFAVPGVRALRSTPLVVDGVMYVGAPNEVYALDARTGRQIWQYRRPRTQGVIGDAGASVNRGVALQGDRLFMVTDDARLVALHRGNGQVLWDVVMADFKQHYGATSAPLVVGDRVVSGVSGGDEGIRGFVAAFDVATGKEAWRFWTVPKAGEPGAETWKGRAIEHGCAATWLTGSHDPALGAIYWTTGNPCPDYNGDERVGDNLWSNSILALDPASGRLRWHFQFTPHDLNDWDAVQTVIAADATFQGQPRKLLLQANRNGFFYVLDRETGKLLLARPFIKNLNWASGVDADSRPQRIAGMEPTWRGTKVCPSVVGATNWMSPAFNPETGLYYVMALERCSIFQKSSRWFEPGESFYGGSTRNVPGETGGKVLRALDINTGRIAWELPQVGDGDTWGGVLSTANGLVFLGEDDGTFTAVNARTGERLWQFAANAVWRGSPMTYMAGDRQYVAVAGGGVVYAFALGRTP